MAERQPGSQGAGAFARLLREALGHLASPERCDAIIRSALAADGLDAVPGDVVGFGTFACGSLCEEVREALGEEAAEAVISDLRPAFLQTGDGGTSSGVRRRQRHSLTSPRANARVVLVASPAPGEVDDLVPLLRDSVKVVAAYDVFSLLSAAQRDLTNPITLLLSDAMPSMQASTLATLGRILPPGTQIFLWGEGSLPEIEPAGASRWTHLGPVSMSEVAEVCLDSLRETDEPSGEVSVRPRVLVAHSDGLWRDMVCRALLAKGMEPLAAPDGFMALERCIDERPHVVVAGMSMDTIDGAQLTALLLGRFEADAPPVILVTSERGAAMLDGVHATVSGQDIEGLVRELEQLVGPTLADGDVG